ncbi:sodium-dependent proline transporter-like [Dysidea avara]|uniref:sodium-dependent proline transporter-like n=1 Tax=Dysidea avara TaxID=196820 RepID=UPI00332F77D4
MESASESADLRTSLRYYKQVDSAEIDSDQVGPVSEQRKQGVFLIPYFIMLLAVGISSFYLELILGQKMCCGPYISWLRYSLRFLYWDYFCHYHHLYIHVLHCHHLMTYSIHICYNLQSKEISVTKEMGGFGWGCMVVWLYEICSVQNIFFISQRYYWYNRVIHVSDDIGDDGESKWQLLISMLYTWLITYLCLFQGITSSGKVAYVTAVFPYIVLTILFFRGITLDGAGDGVEFLCKPYVSGCL